MNSNATSPSSWLTVDVAEEEQARTDDPSPPSPSTATYPRPTDTDYEFVVLSLGDVDLTADSRALARESDFFRRLFDDGQHVQPNGYGLYRLPCRAEPLQAILDFCHFDTYPLLLTSANEYDLMAYHRVLVLAEAYKVTRLAVWIGEERYADVVQRTLHRRMLDGMACAPLVMLEERNTSVGVVRRFGGGARAHLFRATASSHQCPRSVKCHIDHPTRCGQRCSRAAQRKGKGRAVATMAHVDGGSASSSSDGMLDGERLLVVEENKRVIHAFLRASRSDL